MDPYLACKQGMAGQQGKKKGGARASTGEKGTTGKERLHHTLPLNKTILALRMFLRFSPARILGQEYKHNGANIERKQNVRTRQANRTLTGLVWLAWLG